MRGSELLQRARKPAHNRGVVCSWHPDKGKGSHGVLKYDDTRTVVRNLKGELKSGTLHAMRKQLGLKHDKIV